jgi:uncharacterized protein
MVERVVATEAALALIGKLQQQHGLLIFHQSGGCCDGSAPMCYLRGEFRVGGGDRLLGEIGGQPFYIASDQYVYWQEFQLIIDVVQGRGASFSLEIPEGVRFLTRGRLFTEAEREALEAVSAG